MKLQSTSIYRVIKKIMLISIINFILFFVESFFIGGLASLGNITDGMFFVSNHGESRQVSENVWHFNYFHQKIAIVSLPVIAISGLIMKLIVKDERKK